MKKNKGKKLGKFTLWVFMIMVISFLISGSIIAANPDYFDEMFSENGFFISDSILKNPEDIDDEVSVDIRGISRISVDEVSAGINIIRTDGESVKVKYYGTVYKSERADMPVLDVSVTDGTLNITVIREKHGFFGYMTFSEETEIDIYVPGSYTGSLVVDAVSSYIHISDLELDDVRLGTVSGNIFIFDMGWSYLDVESVSGNITSAGNCGDSRFETVSGNVSAVVEELCGDIEIETTSGEINMDMRQEEEGFSLRFSSVSGTFKSSFTGLEIIEAGDNDFKGSYGNSRYKIEAESVSGDMTFD